MRRDAVAPCRAVVRDLSLGGARLELPGAGALHPLATVELSMAELGLFSLSAEVVGIDEAHDGLPGVVRVRFTRLTKRTAWQLLLAVEGQAMHQRAALEPFSRRA